MDPTGINWTQAGIGIFGVALWIVLSLLVSIGTSRDTEDTNMIMKVGLSLFLIMFLILPWAVPLLVIGLKLK